MNRTLFNKVIQIYRPRNFSYKAVRRPTTSTKPNQDTTAHSAVPKDNKLENVNSLAKQIRAKILTTGPITVADYMREVLIHPVEGYYMKGDVFGQQGDFITSPEICQIFGELVAVWLVLEWQKLGSPQPFQVVELGPGRGTLARDVLKVLSRFKLSGRLSVHLVEISPALSKIQAQRFCYKYDVIENDSMPYYQTGETAMGTKVFWYKRLEDVPQEFSIVLAHEFFDALPVHKLQRDNGVWKEILIDMNEDDKREDFRFVISKGQTPISRLFKPVAGEVRDCLEYSLEVDRYVRMIAERFEKHGGIGLIMDYGHFGEKTDTFRAFKHHKLHDPLKEPGTADLTADVDFKRIKEIAEEDSRVVCYGPVEQGIFLQRMEGNARLEQLLNHAKLEDQSALKSGYNMLTDPSQMGSRFKFLSIFPAVVKELLNKHPVSGFS